MRARRCSVRSLAVLGGLAAMAMTGQVPLEAQSQVVVRAISSEGQPVLDLKAGDLTVRTDGRAREVTSLELVRASTEPAPAAETESAPAASDLPPPFATNAAAPAGPAGGREFLIVIDEDGIGPGREAVVRKAVAHLASNASPGDRLGMISLRQGGFDVPASPPGVVMNTLAKFVGRGSQNESLGEMVCRSVRAMQTLKTALRASPPGRTIVFISPGLPASPAGVQTMRRSTGDAAESQLSEVCQIRGNDFEELGAAAAASPASVYVLHYLEGLAATANLSDAQQGLENITGTINGELIRISGGADPSLARVLTETSSYYIATLDGAGVSPRRVDVRTTRDGVKVTARPAGAAPAGAAVRAGSPKEMIRVPDVFRGVPIRAAGFVSRQPGANDLKVVALFEPEEASAKLTAAMVGLFDAKGSLKAQWTAQAAELGQSPVIAALTAAPGKYRMRVAATDAAGNGGTTDYELDVALPDAPPVKLSHMLLGVGQGGFAPRLAFTSADAAAIGFLEIYGVSKDAKVEATFEIVKADGEVMGSGEGTVGAGSGDDARVTYGGFGIATLEPGDYTMRATINIDGKQAGVATRTLRKLK